MAALNCSANRLGLSKTEVDVFVVIHCPFGWGRVAGMGTALPRNDVSSLTINRRCGIQTPGFGFLNPYRGPIS